MFETLIVRRRDRARLEASPLCRHLVLYASVLESQQYQRRTIRRYLFAADRFGRWLVERGVGITDVDDAIVARYVESLGRRRCAKRPHGRLPLAATGARRLVEVLRSEGIIAPATRVPPQDAWLVAFDQYLEHQAGLAAGTRRIYGRFAGSLIRMRFGHTDPEWAALTADDLCDFVRKQAARLKPSACRSPITATRAFLRFLVSQGAVGAELVGAVPTVRQWKQAVLPKYLTADEVERLLATCGQARRASHRDLAIVTMLVRQGLRAGEVAGLQLEDIAWREGSLHVRSPKSGRGRTLPLTEDAGRTLAAYLEGERPVCRHRAVFLRAHPPFGPMSSAAVTTLVARALERAGITCARMGAHALRHTAATQMVRRGATFKDIADVLGHARLETTGIYAKLDIGTLARVALPWPGGAS